MKTLIRNHRTGSQPLFAPGISENGTGARQPPRNIVVASAASVVMLMYSARKNMANFIDEYSVMWPATISPSPSGRSKGTRFVSPTLVTRYMTNDGSSDRTYQRRCWPERIADVDSDPAYRKTATHDRPMAIS